MGRRLNQRNQRRYIQHIEALQLAIENGEEIPENIFGRDEQFEAMLPPHLQEAIAQLKDKFKTDYKPEKPKTVVVQVAAPKEPDREEFVVSTSVEGNFCPRCNKTANNFLSSKNPKLSLKKHIRMCRKPHATLENV